MNPEIVQFDKYEKQGAYHWRQSDRWSREYSPPVEARYTVMLRKVLRGSQVLDLGCGDGYLVDRIAATGSVAFGLDPDSAGVRLAAQKIRGRDRRHIIRGDAYRLPFADHSFDVVLMADVIEHLTEPEVCLGEVVRVLRPDGSLLVSTPHYQEGWRWDERHEREYRSDELRAMLACYFRSVDLSYNWPLRWWERYRSERGRFWLRVLGRCGFNPFAREGALPDGYGQILAYCRGPAPAAGGANGARP